MSSTYKKLTMEMGNSSIAIETGKIALLAGGSVTVRQGDTIVLVAACSSDPRPGLDFFPLQVDYREKFSAAGMMPGGYFKREGRPSEKEILTSRMIDRPLRPLFPKGFINDVQIQASLLSADGENDSDVLSMLGASAALMISDIPFNGPLGALRVGRVEGTFVANPTHAEMLLSDLDLVYAGIEDQVIMIEGAADEVSEDVLRDSLIFANEIVKKQIILQRDLAESITKEKITPKLRLVPEEIASAVSDHSHPEIKECCLIQKKNDRNQAFDLLQEKVVQAVQDSLGESYCTEEAKKTIKNGFQEEIKATVRRLILEEGIRLDGRQSDELRTIECEVGVLPGVHGSALFSRGETQGLVTTTLGAAKDMQNIDSITGGKSEKPFYLHYNFPNFSVGETGRIMGPGRREIGHGALAERSVERVMPKDYPYAVRCVADILSSNGSTSMASVCGATLSLMDAGVPIRKPVAGISCGLVTDGEKDVLLTDILGSEDHYGDMDFKVSGTIDGITGFQLDLKISGISIDLLYQALMRNKTARLEILGVMGKCLSVPRAEVNPTAPRIQVIKINPEKIGSLIGPGGKVIREIQQTHMVNIDINDDGKVTVFASKKEQMDSAISIIEGIVAEAEIGKIYQGLVKNVKDFGAFVEILPGQEGLLHISELADYRVSKVEDICTVGSEVTVKVIDIDDRGRIRLSRRAALEESEE